MSFHDWEHSKFAQGLIDGLQRRDWLRLEKLCDRLHDADGRWTWEAVVATLQRVSFEDGGLHRPETLKVRHVWLVAKVQQRVRMREACREGGG